MKREQKPESLRKANFFKHMERLLYSLQIYPLTYANDPTDRFLFNASNVLANRNRTVEATTQLTKS